MELKERLSQIVGQEYVSDSPEDLEPYSRDYSLVPPAMPDYVVKPKTREEIQQIIQLANEVKMPVVPVSSAMHFYGATIPKMGGSSLRAQP